jgi:arylsulfatase A-like enzyme
MPMKGRLHWQGRIPLVVPLVSLLQGASAAARKPNVIIILTDDQGFDELGVTDNLLVHTPHMDRLADQGVSLVNFNVMPVCSPTIPSGLSAGKQPGWFGMIRPSEAGEASTAEDAASSPFPAYSVGT